MFHHLRGFNIVKHVMRVHVKQNELILYSNTGKVIPLASDSKRARMTHGIDNNWPFTALSFVDWCYPNFANLLSMRLPGHTIFCTPNPQVRNELVMQYKSTCKGTGPVVKIYMQSRTFTWGMK
tara:strand:+ start:2327 stop:2695 length:369 start_codon:yes stop_codon:yes gene_type:complete